MANSSENKARAIVAIVSLLMAGALLMGASSWTSGALTGSSVGVFTTGSEGASSPTGATNGLALTSKITHLNVTVQAPVGVDAGAQNLVAAGIYLRAWIFDSALKAPDGGVGGWWSRAPELDVGPTVGGQLAESFPGVEVNADHGRIAYMPEGCGGLCRVTLTPEEGLRSGVPNGHSNGRGASYAEEQGPIARTVGCVETIASTVGDGGTLTIPTGQRYELTVGSSSAVRLANGTACVGYTVAAGGVGKRVNEGTVRYWTAPVGAGNDGGTAVYTVCSETAGGWAQFCPAP